MKWADQLLRDELRARLGDNPVLPSLSNEQLARVKLDYERMCEVSQSPLPWDEYLRRVREEIAYHRSFKAPVSKD